MYTENPISTTTDAVVLALFEQHYHYYRQIGIETIKQQAGQVEQVSADYQGRIIFELLQNAFDKAYSKILVSVVENNLYIGNDGQHFSYQTDYNYQEGMSARADFQSLCSISTSSKNINTSIGNKGVGFKSVFSVAEGGFVDIHTQGQLLLPEGPRLAPISFRIYDSFKDSQQLPSELPVDVQTELTAQIEKVHLERRDRGVPGYYYPVLLPEPDPRSQSLLHEGMVTVIRIPFAEKNAAELQILFTEIERIHFNFVSLRLRKQHIHIQFQHDRIPACNFAKQISPKILKQHVQVCTLDQKIVGLAQQAGLSIEQPQVALSLRTIANEENHGCLYNYLPTRVPSPFLFVDFHADFHTTVDRKNINLDGPVGNYNKALLRGCLELFFSYLNNYIREDLRVKLHLQRISPADAQTYTLEQFTWAYLYVEEVDGHIYEAVQSILGIGKQQYYPASRFLAGLAERFFSQPRTEREHLEFFENCEAFSITFGRNYGDATKWPGQFRDEIAKQLRKLNARVIPIQAGKQLSINEELIYRENKKDDTPSFIPTFLGINLIGFKVPDAFRKPLDIKEFTDRNEILKHYRQVSPSGQYDQDERLTEEEQQELLGSIASLMGNTDQEIAPTHRYHRYIQRSQNENTSLNLANFSLSTVFLKLKNGQYKPAQLCQFQEVDLSFLPTLPESTTPQGFLAYLGVSPYKEYRFVDKVIWDKLRDGLDYLPALWKRKTQEDQLQHSRIIKEVSIIHHQEAIHPALINDNQYPFLKELKLNDIREEEIHLLIKRYDSFPKEYFRILLGELAKVTHRKEALLRFYQQIFIPLFNKEMEQYLVCRQDLLYFTTTKQFYVVHSEAHFQLLRHTDLPILCFYKSALDPVKFKLEGKILNLTESAVQTTGSINETQQFREDLFPKIFYLLVELTQSSNSETDYFENPNRISELSKRLAQLQYVSVDTLQREIHSDLLDQPLLSQRDYDLYERTLYVRKDIPDSKKAAAIASGVFNNSRFAHTVELILFHKTTEALEVEYKHYSEYRQKFKRNWISDYDEKLAAFTQAILIPFNGAEFLSDPEWYRYNPNHPSPFLLHIDQQGQLGQLQTWIADQKDKLVEGLFADFTLEIDLREEENAITRLHLILEKAGPAAKAVYQPQLDALIGRLGAPDTLAQLEELLKAEYPEAFTAPVTASAQEDMSEAVRLQADIERIFQNLQCKDNTQTPAIDHFAPGITGVTMAAIPINTKKVIFQGTTSAGKDLEIVGATGEEQVLYLFIQEFLAIPTTEERTIALKGVHELISSKLRSDAATQAKHTRLFEDCLAVIDQDRELRKALIPFFYITMHYQYAFVDLVAWHQQQAVLVEVKTTRYHGNPNFRISASEVNEASAQPNYLLVRVSPDQILFMGNPFYQIKHLLTTVSGDNFAIKPQSYAFSFKAE